MSQGTPQRTHSETILLVEDQDDVRELASDVLGDLGYSVLAARDPGEAVALSSRHDGPIDLLIADVVLPGESGPALAARLASRRPEMRVLLVSGHSDHTIPDRAAVDAEWAFLEKPFSVGVLTDVVRRVLDERRGRAL